MIKNVSALEKMLKLEAGTLSQAIESTDEIEVTLPELIIRTSEEQATYETNLDTEKKERYDAGKEKGIKDAINEVAPKFGIDLTDKAKTVDNFAEAFKSKIVEETGKEPSQKIQELERDNEKLRTNYTDLEGQFNTFKTDVTQKETRSKIDSQILSAIPDNGLLINKDEVALIFKNRYNVDLTEGGNLEIKQNGEVLKNTTTLNPLGVNDVMGDFIKPYVKPVEGGAGGTDQAGTKKTGYDSFKEEMETKGHNEGSAEFSRELMQRQKDGTIEI